MRNFLLTAALGLTAVLSAGAENTYLDGGAFFWYASSTSTEEGSLDAIHDNDVSTYWHSDYNDSSTDRNCPHWILIDRLYSSETYTGLSYYPRMGSNSNTYVTEYRIYLSDKAFSTTMTDSDVAESVLGTPTFSGTWDSTYGEQVVSFGGTHKERYVLFVIDNTVSGRSAACAELRLISKLDSSTVSGGSSSTTGGDYNSVKITLPDGTEHRIAVDGENLAFNLTGTSIRMTNSGITVVYDISDVKQFNFEHYDFPTDVYYVGDRDDTPLEPSTPASPFQLYVTPEAGKIAAFGNINITSDNLNALSVNTASTGKITLTNEGKELLSLSPSTVLPYKTSQGYTISGLEYTAEGDYIFNIPAGFFTNTTDGSTNAAYNCTWTLSALSDKAELAGTDNVLGISHRDGILYVTGITQSSAAVLYGINGMQVALAHVDGNGVARIRTSGIAAGAYVLHVDGKSFKIIL
jgi:hypothetical protein